MTNPFPGNPLWPSDFQGCTVEGQYLALDGTAIAGTVTFTPSPSSLLAADDELIIVPRTYQATLDITGAFSITIPASDDPDINPQGWTYAVSENFSGGRKYNINAPQGATINLCDVSPVPSSNGAPIWRGPKGEAGGIQMVNGHTGDIVTITYADVGADQTGAAAAVSVASMHRSNNLSDVASVATARTNLGLGTAATQPSTAFEPTGAGEAFTELLVPIGAYMMYPTGTVPNSHWMLCQGQAVSRTTYAILFGVIGTIYGLGDGSTTFNLPNLKGRLPVGRDSGQAEFLNSGQTGGNKTHLLTTPELALHSHAIEANIAPYSTGTGRSVYFGDGFASHPGYGGGIVNGAGGNTPFNIQNPYLVVNFIIRVI